MINIQQAIQDIQAATDNTSLQAIFDSYLGKKGQLSDLFKKLATATPEEKKELGQTLSTAKTQITQAYDSKAKELQIQEINKQLENDIVDSTIPAAQREAGHASLLTNTRREVEEICHNMGFIVEH
jgi:phenylalanyl-tRNA synthetase alpha chain